jgi:hypothetical protein
MFQIDFNPSGFWQLKEHLKRWEDMKEFTGPASFKSLGTDLGGDSLLSYQQLLSMGCFFLLFLLINPSVYSIVNSKMCLEKTRHSTWVKRSGNK